MESCCSCSGGRRGRVTESGFNKKVNCINSSPGGGVFREAFCRGEPTECKYAASVICHSFDTKTAKYFLLVCNHVSLFSPVSWQPNITPRAKRTEIQYYKPPPPFAEAVLPNYHPPSPWKPFGWVSNHSNLHLRCSKDVLTLETAKKGARLQWKWDSMFSGDTFAWKEFRVYIFQPGVKKICMMLMYSERLMHADLWSL